MKKRLTKSYVVKMYEGLTVNADLPEQLSSFTDRINKDLMNNAFKKEKKLLGIQFKEKTSKT